MKNTKKGAKIARGGAQWEKQQERFAQLVRTGTAATERRKNGAALFQPTGAQGAPIGGAVSINSRAMQQHIGNRGRRWQTQIMIDLSTLSEQQPAPGSRLWYENLFEGLTKIAHQSRALAEILDAGETPRAFSVNRQGVGQEIEVHAVPLSPADRARLLREFRAGLLDAQTLINMKRTSAEVSVTVQHEVSVTEASNEAA